MPIYEFQCPKGHKAEQLVPVGTKLLICEPCLADPATERGEIYARRILSPTPTTFVHAGGRKL